MTGGETRKGVGWLVAYAGIMALMTVSPSLFVAQTPTEINEFTATKLKELSNFYLLLVVLFLGVVAYYGKDARIPETKSVLLNFALSWLVSSLILIIVFTMIAVPNWYFSISEITIGKGSFVQWSVVAFSEGLLAVLLIPAVFHWGEYAQSESSAKGSIMGIRYNIPGMKRIAYGLPAAGFMAMLHYAAYRGSISSMVIAFVMFAVFWVMRESFGFGASEGLHFGWNFAVAWTFGGI